MGFEVKNTSTQSIFREDFNERDFDDPAFKTDTFTFPSPYGTLQATTWWFDGIKMTHSKNDLLNTSKSATEIARELGFSSLQHFSAAFSKKFGGSPKKMK